MRLCMALESCDDDGINQDADGPIGDIESRPVTWQTLAILAYALIALVFLDNTYREGKVYLGGQWDAHRIAGLALCTLWPLVLAYAAVSAYRNRHAR